MSCSINLFCLPPAGSSASIYYNWNKYTDSKINIVPLEYPGHGRKIREPLTDQPQEIAQRFYEEIKAYSNQPFGIFGHSVGGSVLWHLEEKLKADTCYDDLKLLAISGRPAPKHLQHMAQKSQLTDQQLIQEVRSYNNFPEEILNNSDALNFFLNILKNDFKLSDNMLHDQPTQTHKPLLTLHGIDDPFIQNSQMMADWQAYSHQWLGHHALPGDHFYFLNHDTLLEMLNILSKHLT